MTKEDFGEMILKNKESLYRVSRSILHNDVECQDAMSEAITKAFEKLHTLKKDEYAKTWLIRILMNECYAICRQNKWKYDGDMEMEVRTEDYRELYGAIEELNEKQRLVIVLYHLEGYSIKEIAKMMRTSAGAVKMHLSRGRKKLRDYLEGEGL